MPLVMCLLKGCLKEKWLFVKALYRTIIGKFRDRAFLKAVLTDSYPFCYIRLLKREMLGEVHFKAVNGHPGSLLGIQAAPELHDEERIDQRDRDDEEVLGCPREIQTFLFKAC